MKNVCIIDYNISTTLAFTAFTAGTAYLSNLARLIAVVGSSERRLHGTQPLGKSWISYHYGGFYLHPRISMRLGMRVLLGQLFGYDTLRLVPPCFEISPPPCDPRISRPALGVWDPRDHGDLRPTPCCLLRKFEMYDFGNL